MYLCVCMYDSTFDNKIYMYKAEIAAVNEYVSGVFTFPARLHSSVILSPLAIGNKHNSPT